MCWRLLAETFVINGARCRGFVGAVPPRQLTSALPNRGETAPTESFNTQPSDISHARNLWRSLRMPQRVLYRATHLFRLKITLRQ